MRQHRSLTQRLHLYLPLCVLIVLAWVGASCTPIQPTSNTVAPEDAVRAIEDRLQKAFATLPPAMATQDFTTFNQYVATKEQSADEQGLNNIYSWLQDVRLKGTAPAATSEYKLNELRITNLQMRGNDATAHVYLDMTKVANGDQANAAFTVDQDIALVLVNGQWLISGADQAKITDKLKAPQ
ncbi:MAG: hypothetical protein R3C14_28135 [Caldilineaceae bacterium]